MTLAEQIAATMLVMNEDISEAEAADWLSLSRKHTVLRDELMARYDTVAAAIAAMLRREGLLRIGAEVEA